VAANRTIAQLDDEVPVAASGAASAPVQSGAAPQRAADGILVVDKPADWTSHDVVSRVRSLAGTRRVGHAGTLDPMATGVLVIGVGRATRLLGHISGHHKAYSATIRLGWSTVTDDAQGERIPGAVADHLGMDDLLPAIEELSGPIMQRPSAVSAIKVAGRRAHDRVRAGEEVDLAPRPVLVTVFDVLEVRPETELGCLDLDVEVECSSGTYVRALARDLGEALGVGGHLTALRRTRVGGFDISEARTLDELAEEKERDGSIEVLDIATAVASAFPVVALPETMESAVRHGRAIDLTRVWEPFREVWTHNGSGTALDWAEHVEPHALFTQDGEFLALVAPKPDGSTRYVAVFARP
jgi:tRNA pseudouridine55 synthase